MRSHEPTSTIDIALRLPWHEAGHAVVAHALGRKVTSIAPGESLGATTVAEHRNKAGICWADCTEIGRDIAYSFGGYVAERRYETRRRSVALVGATHDFAHVEGWNPFSSTARGAPIFAEMAGDLAGWRSFVRAWYRVAVEIVRLNWEPLSALADELCFAFGDDQTLKGRALRRLLRPVRPYFIGLPRWQWPNGVFARLRAVPAIEGAALLCTSHTV